MKGDPALAEVVPDEGDTGCPDLCDQVGETEE